MYLWNTKALAKELKEGTLTERQKFNYYFLNLIVYTVLAQIMIYAGIFTAEVSAINLIVSMITISVAIIGTYICFEANSQGDGINFLERYFCLVIPISIKIIVISIPIAIFITVVVVILFAIFLGDYDTSSFSELISVAYIYIVDIIAYYFLYKYLKLVSGADSGNTNS